MKNDNNPYTINQNTDSVTKTLEELSLPLLSWFRENKLELNFDKCHLIVSDIENPKIKQDDFTTSNSKKKRLLGIIFDDRLKFQFYIELAQKVSLKLSALSRVAPLVDLLQKNILLNVFFRLATALWFGCAILNSRILNSKINKLHERCLRLIYNDKY